jgi:hypothetical protein
MPDAVKSMHYSRIGSEIAQSVAHQQDARQPVVRLA